MEGVTAATVQFLANFLLAVGSGQQPSYEDMDKAGAVLCQMVKSEDRFSIKVGEATIWCNNRPPVIPERS